MIRFWRGTHYAVQAYGDFDFGQFYGPVEKWAYRRNIGMSRIYLMPFLLPVICICVPLMVLGAGAEWVMRTLPKYLPKD